MKPSAVTHYLLYSTPSSLQICFEISGSKYTLYWSLVLALVLITKQEPLLLMYTGYSFSLESLHINFVFLITSAVESVV